VNILNVRAWAIYNIFRDNNRILYSDSALGNAISLYVCSDVSSPSLLNLCQTTLNPFSPVGCVAASPALWTIALLKKVDIYQCPYRSRSRFLRLTNRHYHSHKWSLSETFRENGVLVARVENRSSSKADDGMAVDEKVFSKV
jgi:hypothetical protein